MFEDIAKIRVKAGDGGNGAVSFRREKFVSAGGPDGGDGGRGGNILFVVDSHQSTLIEYTYRKNYVADNGDPGGAKKCYGKDGKNLTLKVPRGTLIKEAKSGQIIADLSHEDSALVARGGNGGWGNSHFATPTRQVPSFSKPGLPGESFDLILELKLLADVGLVGFPNVGKSTLISVVSAAKPKIANYHFTTLRPNLGVVRLDAERSFVMADIPGLIEDASEGKGLGHAFLRHVDRCRLLLHIVDISGVEGRNPKEDFEAIMQELVNFNENLASRSQIVVGNKIDIASEEQREEFRAFIEEKGLPYYEISAPTHLGTKDLMEAVWGMVEKLPPITVYEPDFVPEIPEEDKFAFTVNKVEDDIFEVEAPWLLRTLENSDMDDYSSLQYFQRTLVTSGIIEELKNQGIEDGDLVSIYDFEFEYVS